MRFALIAALFLLARVPASAGVTMDVFGGSWKDDFSDLSGLTRNQQASQAYPTGITVSTALQVWTQPNSSSQISESFTMGDVGSGLVVSNPNSALEEIRLWRKQYEVTRLGFPYQCEFTDAQSCALPPHTLKYQVNGMLLEGSNAIRGIPLASYSGTVTGSDLVIWGWGTAGKADCCIGVMSVLPSIVGYPQKTGCIASYYGLPLLSGIVENQIVPNQGYNATFISGLFNLADVPGGCPSPHTNSPTYIGFEFYNLTTKTGYAFTGMGEANYIYNTMNVTETDYGRYTPFTIHDPGLGAGAYDFRAISDVSDLCHSHCTRLGPIIVAADQGTYTSPVFDTLSDKTRWVSISWTQNQSQEYGDIGKSIIADDGKGGIGGFEYMHAGTTNSGKGFDPQYCVLNQCVRLMGATAMTPSELEWGVDNTGAKPVENPAATRWKVNHFNWEDDIPPHVLAPPYNDYTLLHTGTGMSDSTGVAGSLSGRYLQYRLILHSRSTAAEVDNSLSPLSLHPSLSSSVYFGGFTPVVRRIEVHYYACAAQVVSRPITPTSVGKWKTLTYVVSRTPAETVTVDVLSADGSVLLANVKSGASLASLDAYRYHSIKLRALLVSDPADCSKRPTLEGWQVTWEPLPQVLELDRNAIRPKAGQRVQGQVRVDQAGHVTVRVHDAAGQAVKLLLDDDLPAQAAFVVWDGHNERGETVAPGIYFISAEVPGAVKVRRVAVIR